ncbi:MFS transporter [Glaciimonas sp. PCH181]|uniref:MFS transporter n=1 Tax=Glaciimonas sp. PCH181 TaxID=2133943 RepID=UPI000D3ACEDB|nr:MFS transporter [Glaciimonas sp. PCH181]PUA19340.1 MFS transporter [Glaciimonas sp. PCH181]
MGDQLHFAAIKPVRLSGTKLLVATTIGNALEFFDFTVFGFFAIVIGHQFFSPLSADGQLMSSVATFGVGFVMRPIGGILLGMYADRAGRGPAMTLTLSLMTLGVCLAGLTPTYDQIGIAAPILMVIARLIQGFSAGGEVGPATTVLLEHAPVGARGWYTSWQLASQGLGIAAGAASAAGLSYFLPHDALYAWGWRLPFLCGAVILPVGIFIRRQLAEFESHPQAKATAPELHSPFTVMLRDHLRNFLAGILLVMGGAVTAYMIIFFVPTYAIRELKLGESASYACAIATGLIILIVAPITGKFADAFGRRLPILAARVVLITSLYPAYVWLTSEPSTFRLFVVLVGLAIPFTIQGAPSVTMIPELFPKSLRATATGSVYSFGVAIFGGLTQLTAIWLIHVTGNKLAPAIAVTICLVLSTFSLLLIKRLPPDPAN